MKMISTKVLLAIAMVGVLCLVLAGGLMIKQHFTDKTNSDNKDVVIATTAATIAEAGFCTGIDKMSPDGIVTSGVVGNACSYAKVENLDRGTSVTVYVTAPDGSVGKTNTLAVNANTYLYAYYNFDQVGDYIVTWAVEGKESIATTFTVK